MDNLSLLDNFSKRKIDWLRELTTTKEDYVCNEVKKGGEAYIIKKIVLKARNLPANTVIQITIAGRAPFNFPIDHFVNNGGDYFYELYIPIAIGQLVTYGVKEINGQEIRIHLRGIKTVAI